MTSSSHVRALGALALILPLLLSCSRGTQKQESVDAPAPVQFPDSYLITSEQIAASGASTAWDALRLTVPVLQFRESGQGTPQRISRRGRSSINLNDQVRVWLDNNRVHNIRDLDLIPAAELESIQVLSPLDATTYYGGSSTTGVIRIRTKTAGS